MRKPRVDGPVQAVEYVRMSTEQQHFSIDAQRKLIRNYADEHGYEILRTYADPGQSGLTLRGRKALQKLLSDALGPQRDFSAVLVRDVSRWGRFQDPDQAAHYEFICRQAGVQIIYCAEPFIADNTPVSTIVKHLKRVMASEYSRDVSAKMSLAHLYQARLGFRQGGNPIYGFRRLLVDEQGLPQRLLEFGDRKTLIGERVRIVPGPAEEQEVVRAIFDLYVRQEWSLIEIALFLRNERISGSLGGRWTGRMVRNVLTSELCIGCYTYNRTTQKLQTPLRKNSEDLWVRAPDACTPTISKALFKKAQRRLLKRRPSKLTHAKMLEHLRALVAEKGRVSRCILNRTPFVPHSGTYTRYFGDIKDALKQIDYVPPMCISGSERAWSKDDLRSGLKRLHEKNGFLSRKLIMADPSLPSYSSIQRKIGTLCQVYDFIDVPHGGAAEIRREAIERKVQLTRGRSGNRGPRRNWNERNLAVRLRNLFEQHGYLSAPLIDTCPDLPSTATVINRFGTLLDAYRAAGWDVSRSDLAVARRARGSNR